MQFKKLTSQMQASGAPCIACRKRSKAGEVVLAFKYSTDDVLERWLVLHRRCVEALLTDAPKDDDAIDTEFVLLRTMMMATGSAFPQNLVDASLNT